MTDEGRRTPRSEREMMEIPITRRDVASRPVYVWEATVTFTTEYDLPPGVAEAAVRRAIAGAKTYQIESLKPSTFPTPTQDRGGGAMKEYIERTGETDG